MVHLRHILLLSLMLLAFPQLVLASKTHVVRKSESLQSIARKYHVSIDEIKSVNNLTGTKIAKGTRLIIPSQAAAQGKKAKVAEKAQSYKVGKGESLAAVAKKTGVKMAELRRLNGIKGNRVKPGQILALREKAEKVEESPAPRMARLQLTNRELLNDHELTSTLAELSDINEEQPVDLAKKLEDNASGVNSIKKTAYSFLGARYRFGGNSRTALDCSSFTQQVFRDLKVSLPRTAREQFLVGNEVVRGDLQKGDLVFFQTYARFPSHVGIYLGNRKMIHASSRDRRVVISSMDTPYYLSRYLGARRIGKFSLDSGLNFNELLMGVEEEKETDVMSNDMMGIALSQTN